MADWVNQLVSHFLNLDMLERALVTSAHTENGVCVQLGKHNVLFSQKLFDRLCLSLKTAHRDRLCLVNYRFWNKDGLERRVLEFVYPDDHEIVTFDLTDYEGVQ